VKCCSHRRAAMQARRPRLSHMLLDRTYVHTYVRHRRRNFSWTRCAQRSFERLRTQLSFGFESILYQCERLSPHYICTPESKSTKVDWKDIDQLLPPNSCHITLMMTTNHDDQALKTTNLFSIYSMPTAITLSGCRSARQDADLHAPKTHALMKLR
jgi:hypothetical protein